MAFPVPVAGSTNNGGGGSTNFVYPAGVAVGDVLILIVTGAQSGTSLNFTTPSGWTQIGSANSTKTWMKLADSSDVAAAASPGYINIVDDGSPSFASVQGVMIGVPGPYTTLPTYYHSNAFNSTGTITDSIGITPVGQQGTLIQLIADTNTTALRSSSTYAVATSNPAWTELVDASNLASGSSRCHVAVAYGGWGASSGTATGNITFSISGTSAGTQTTVHVPGLPFSLTPVVAAASGNTPTFVLTLIPAAISSVASMGAAVASEVANRFSNLVKHAAASISNLTKS